MTIGEPSIVEKPTSLASFTEEELMLKDTGKFRRGQIPQLAKAESHSLHYSGSLCS